MLSVGGAPGQGWLHQHHDVGELEPWIDEVERISDLPPRISIHARLKLAALAVLVPPTPTRVGASMVLVTLHKKLSNAGSSILFRAKEST